MEVINWSIIATHLTVNNNKMHQAIAGAIVDFVKMCNRYDTPGYIKENVEDIILHQLHILCDIKNDYIFIEPSIVILNLFSLNFFHFFHFYYVYVTMCTMRMI